MEQIKKQLREIEIELEKDPEDPTLWMERGIGQHLLGEYTAAEERLKHSLSLEKSAPAHYNLANCLVELDRIPEAIHHYLESLALRPDHIPSLNNLADAYEQAGEPEKAGEIFGYLSRLSPDEPLSHFNLANFYLRHNQHEEAARLYRKVITMDDTFSDAWYNLSWILKQIGARADALLTAREGLEKDPEHEELKKMVEELENTSAGI